MTRTKLLLGFAAGVAAGAALGYRVGDGDAPGARRWQETRPAPPTNDAVAISTSAGPRRASPPAEPALDAPPPPEWALAAERLLSSTEPMKILLADRHWSKSGNLDAGELERLWRELEPLRSEAEAAGRAMEGAGYRACMEKLQKGEVDSIWVGPSTFVDAQRLPPRNTLEEIQLLMPQDGMVTVLRASSLDDAELGSLCERRLAILNKLHDAITAALQARRSK